MTSTYGQLRTGAAIAKRMWNKQARMADELRATGHWKVTYLCTACGAETGSNEQRCATCAEAS